MSRFNAPKVKERGIGSTQSSSSSGAGSNLPHPDRFHAGPQNAHIDTDSKDERSIANRLASASKASSSSSSSSHPDADTQTSDSQPLDLQDPLEPARAHGNEPSRGAKIDAQIQIEEYEELLRKKNV